MMRGRQQSLFEDSRLTLEGSIELSIASLNEYGGRYHLIVQPLIR